MKWFIKCPVAQILLGNSVKQSIFRLLLYKWICVVLSQFLDVRQVSNLFCELERNFTVILLKIMDNLLFNSSYFRVISKTELTRINDRLILHFLGVQLKFKHVSVWFLLKKSDLLLDLCYFNYFDLFRFCPKALYPLPSPAYDSIEHPLNP